MHAGLVLSAHVHNKYCRELVKVVNNATLLVAYVWLLAIRRLECKAVSNQNVRHIYLPSLDLVQRESVVFG